MIFQIKRSPGQSAPTTDQLLEGELAYTQDKANNGANAKLYIESVDVNDNPVIDVIGGKYYTRQVDSATPNPIEDTLVRRDASGNAFFNLVSASLFSGVATSANKLQTPRQITITGAVVGSAMFDGSNNITITTVTSEGSFPTEEFNQVKADYDNATSFNEANTLVRRDDDGDFSASTITADRFVGVATTSERLATPRRITIAGDASGFATFDGSRDITINITLADVIGTLQEFESIKDTVNTHTSENVPNSLVFRDANGNFAANIISANLFNGTAANAVKLQSARRITVSGAVAGSAMFDGSNNINIVTTLDSGTQIVLGQNTFGGYVESVEGFNGIIVENTVGTEEGAKLRIGFDENAVEFSEFIKDIVGDMVIGNSEVGMTVTYDDIRGKLNFTLGASTNAITLGSSTTLINDNEDRGVEFRYVDCGLNKFGFFGYDESSGNFTFIKDAGKQFGQYFGDLGTLDVASITGSAARLTFPRKIEFNGDVHGQYIFDGSSDKLVNLQLTHTGVDEGTYGSSSSVPVFNVNYEGRILEVYNTPIAVTSAQITNFNQEVLRVFGDAVSGGNEEAGIDVRYNPVTQKIDFNVDDFIIRLLGDVGGAVTVQNLTDSTIQTTLADTGVNDGEYGSESEVAVFEVDTKGRITFARSQLIQIESGQIIAFDRDVRDVVGSMVTNQNTELGIIVTYDDFAGVLNFDVSDFDITLAGDVVGTARVTNLGSVVINTTIQPNSIVLGTDTTGNYVATITSVDPGIVVQNSGTENAAVTLALDLENSTTRERIWDVVGQLITPGVQRGITVTYNDLSNRIDFDVNDFQIALSGDVAGVVTVQNLNDVQIITTIQPNSVELGHDTFGNYVATITGQDGIIVQNSGTETAAVNLKIDTTNSAFTEGVQDIVGQMITDNIEDGITVTYNDTIGKLNFNVNDFKITLAGDLSGEVTIMDLQNGILHATIVDDAVRLGDDTTGQYAKKITTSGVGLSITPANIEDGTDYEIVSNATPNNVANTIVSRDQTGSARFQDITLDGTLYANGGSIQSNDTIFELLTQNPEVSIVRFAHHATNLSLGATTGSTFVRNNLVVDGTLTVNGGTTVVNSTNLSVDDPVITLGGDIDSQFDDNKDRGIEFRYYEGPAGTGLAKRGFFGYDDSTQKFVYLLNAQNNDEVFTGTVGAFELSNSTISAANITGFDERAQDAVAASLLHADHRGISVEYRDVENKIVIKTDNDAMFTTVTADKGNFDEINTGNSSTTSYSYTKSNAAPGSVVGFFFDPTLYRSAEAHIQITQGTNYQLLKVLVIHNGSQVFFTEFGNISTSSDIAVVNFEIVNGNVVLTSSQANAAQATYKVSITTLTV